MHSCPTTKGIQKMPQYDLIVVGTGPGGYVCAIKAAQLGLKVAVVEKREQHGGTCLNVGCIPSKALLHATEMFAEVNHNFGQLGIKTGKVALDWKGMMTHKQTTVEANVSGISYLFKKNKIDSYQGVGRVLSAGKVEITQEKGKKTVLETRNVVIATGSVPASLPGIKVDERKIVTSTGALDLKEIPKKMVVIGAGVIGLEIGSVFSRLGAEVVFVEFMDKILGSMDSDVSKQFQRILKKQGLDFKLSTKVTGVKLNGNTLRVSVESVDGKNKEEINADVVLVAVGRSPFTEDLGIAEIGVKMDKVGRIEVNERFETNVSGVYAIGDVIAGPMLAHKAEDEGVAVAEILTGQAGHVNYDVIPSVVYTMPEVASIGKSEDELKSGGVGYKTGKFPFTANGRAKSMLHSDGFVKILADERTDRVLGVHIVGAGAGEMIHEAAVLMEFGGSSEDLARTCHAHPTLSETVKEAALATFAKPIHI